ncbi:glutamine amidotransferase-related protein [Rhodovibrionaceae bacterium A322]
MKVAILETGRPTEEFKEKYGTYSGMFVTLFKDVAAWEFEIIHLLDGQDLPAPADFDAYIITGSAFGAYDPEPWIPAMEAFIRAVAETNIPLVGICFGHQIIAQALGGTVEKSDKGWGVGVHEYEIQQQESWMEPALDRFAIPVIHQDQVISPPESAKILGGNNFCPFGILSYGQNILTFQGHPEHPRTFGSDLLSARRGVRIPEQVADIGLASFNRPGNEKQIAHWIHRFVETQSEQACAE